jgi:hypothetical protein
MKNIFFIAAAFAAAAPACAVTLTFDELATQPVQGLSTNGVSFGFTVGTQTSQDAVYNRPGPAGSAFLSGAVLEGDARGVLTLSFPSPTPVLNFGVALTAPSSLTPGLTVQLLGPNAQAVGTQALNTTGAGTLSQGSFNFSGALLSSAVIDFNDGLLTSPFRFAIDNLTVQPGASLPGTGSGTGPISGGGPGIGTAVPAPPVIALGGIGLLAMGLSRRRFAGKRI